MGSRHKLVAAAALALATSTVVLAVPQARAFCGFYVGGADAKLFNNATLVVMMREGTRTVLSMQNNYQGPPSAFAMVVPVPIVLQKENVKTLPPGVFDRVDTLAAPRLVEYWEVDPCAPEEYPEMVKSGAVRMEGGTGGGAKNGHGVKIEAQFTVGEYDVVVLSAGDAAGLDKWLRENKYNIPEGAEPLFKPYIAEGWKFFVAKVDPAKVTFKDGQAMLSPLRFHYDSPDFRLPVRLGLINSGGTQDLIVHILARGQRYEVANYKNVTIPTNITVGEDIRGVGFARFYAALFDATVEKNPGAVITEYAWDSATCDPCPGEPLHGAELLTLGGDALPGVKADEIEYGGGFVLTRLHARYGKESLGEDLVFQAAGPIAGGREHLVANGKLEEGSRPEGYNNFQGRYAIRHEWKGDIKCDKPVRGRWGGPWASVKDAPSGAAAAKDTAFAARGGVDLPRLVRHDVPELGLKMATGAAVGGAGKDPPRSGTPSTSTPRKTCGCRAGGAADDDSGPVPAAALVGLGALALVLTTRRTRRSSR